MSYFELMWSHT